MGQGSMGIREGSAVPVALPACTGTGGGTLPTASFTVD